MRVAFATAIGVAGACAVVLVHGIAWDVVGAAVTIGALAVIARSVIGLAGDAGAPREGSSSLRRDPHPQ